MLSRKKAEELVRQKIGAENLRKHCYAVGAIMRGLAENLGEDVKEWELCGLLHDIDYEKTKDDHSRHGLVSAQVLQGKVSDEVIQAIKAHNFKSTGVEPEVKMDFALIAADAVSGLVIATALIRPSKSLDDVRVKSITKKFKQKDFARACNRDYMLYCEKLGLEKKEFFGIALGSLKKISDKLGL